MYELYVLSEDFKKGDYEQHLKPVSYIIKIFNNVLNGQYLQFGQYASLKPDVVQDIFKTLCNLIFSFKTEDLNGHIEKLKSFYSVLKFIFCDSLNFLSEDIFEFFISKILEIVLEGIDSLNSLANYTCNLIVNFLIINLSGI